MKISMWIPKNREYSWIQKFVSKEIAQANNIKLPSTRKATIRSLTTVMNNARRGSCIFAEDTDFTLEPYDGKQTFYKCANEYIKPSVPENFN